MRGQPYSTRLPVLPAARRHPTTETSQRFLASACDSVAGLAASHDRALALSEDAAAAPEGLWPEYLPMDRPALVEQAVDARRAMVVFAGAGLDTTVKQLIRDAIPGLVDASDQARQKFLDFTEEALKRADGLFVDECDLYSAMLKGTEIETKQSRYTATLNSLKDAPELQGLLMALGSGYLGANLQTLQITKEVMQLEVYIRDLVESDRAVALMDRLLGRFYGAANVLD